MQTDKHKHTGTHRYLQISRHRRKDIEITDTVVNNSATEATTGIWTDLQILREILKGRRTDV